MAEKAKKTTKTKTTTKPTVKTPKSPSATAKKSAKSSCNVCKIICIVIGALAIIAVVIALVVALINRAPDDSYFVSDSTKYVLNITNNTSDENSTEVVQTVHIVYEYSGDAVTSIKTYYEFTNADVAKAAYDDLIANLAEDDESTYELKGKYIIVIAPKAAVESLSVDEVKSQIEFYESIQNGEMPTGTKADVIEETTEEETTEE